MFKVKRNYGNGFEVEVEAAKMTEIIEHLSVADELFMDVRCAVKDGDNLLLSETVRFVHRKTDKYDFYEQVCTDGKTAGGKLKYFKRKLGQHSNDVIGSMFVDKNPDFKGRDSDYEMGLAGWHKYIGTGGSGFNNNGSSYGSNAPQREQAPPPRREPERQPAASSVSYDDIPF